MDSETVQALRDLGAQAVAAGVGAWAAFRLEASRQARAEINTRAQSLREALFSLISQRNFLLELEQQSLGPLRANPHRHLFIKPNLADANSQPINVGELMFLLRSKPAGSLLSELELSERRFLAVTALSKAHSQLHLRMQERLDAAAPADVEPTTDGLSPLVGRSLVMQMKHAADALYAASSLAISTNRECVERIQGLMEQEYPKERVPRIEETPPDSTAGSNTTA